ncbi:MAG: hypothetical protein ACRERD_21540 [Candidatus Binatia bacterium]
MKLADLSLDIRQQIARRQFDLFVEKHEGPWSWEWWLKNDAIEFLRANSFDVLLPVEKRNHKNIVVLRCVVGDNGQVLTIFLKDTTYESGVFAGRVAVCERVDGEQWYLATLYHEWLIIDDRHP